MSNEELLAAHLQNAQLRATAGALSMPISAKELRKRLMRLLVVASEAEVLTTKHHEFESMVKLHSNGTLTCGPAKGRNQHRDPTLPHVRRADGAWFDFAITFSHQADGVEIVAYAFEIRLPDGSTPPFVRFDLNHAGHHNMARGLRCHLHPGTDDWSVPALALTPIEALGFVVYGLRPERDRHP